MVDVHYQRHGPAEETLKLSDSYQPETLRNESWFTFGDDGKLSDMHSQSRTKDGKVWSSSHLENGRVVYEGHIVEPYYSPDLHAITVQGVRQRLEGTQASERAVITAHADAPTATIRGVNVLQIETSRRDVSGGRDVSPGNYVSVYTYDLDPVREIRREYALPDGSHSLRTETVVVDASGTETVVESEDYLAFEVLTL
jgi:hypothetical protein